MRNLESPDRAVALARASDHVLSCRWLKSDSRGSETPTRTPYSWHEEVMEPIEKKKT
jgi:hypothetical protein